MSETIEDIKRLIRESGRNISDIAEDAGLNKGMLSKLMNGKRALSVESVEAVAKALGHRIRIEPVIKRSKRSTTKG